MMSYLTFYDQHGKPTAYTEDHEHIFTFSGEPVAYLYDESVYSYTGKHLGRFTDGWVRDNDGMCVFYTDNTSGGPVKPVRQVRPVRSVKQVRPIRSIKEIRPVRPVRSLSWSPLSSYAFFKQ
jgi:hypothetical protein